MKKSSLSQHDSLFKEFLGDIDVVRDFLESHLPPYLRERCDFSTLAMESSSFIEDDLHTHCSDMLYSVQTKAGKRLYLHIGRAPEPPRKTNGVSHHVLCCSGDAATS